MDKIEFRKAQVNLENQIDGLMAERKHLYQYRKRFVSHFTVAKIKSMPIEEFAPGYGKPVTGFNFCYGLERDLDGLGRILGAPAPKFGVYYSKEKRKIQVTKKWGATYEIAFSNIKNSIIELIDAGENQDLQTISRNPISKMFKGKILSTYFPDIYLNIFSEDYLNYYLTQLDIDNDRLIKEDIIYKKGGLLEFKNHDPVMRDWSIDIFSCFLNNYYPGRPPKEQKPQLNDPLADYRPILFPTSPSPSFVNMDILEVKDLPVENLSKSRSNPDYEQRARKNKILGDRGEYIVELMEKNRLTEAGFTDLATKVKKVEFDYEGYDILSFETDGSNRFIEVKATTRPAGPLNFFISVNELEKAKHLANYHIYIVFDILKSNPKIWIVGNPFCPEHSRVKATPISFKVQVNARQV